MEGTILQVSISAGGIPKRAVAEALITPLGLAGDGHNHPQFHGGPEKAVLIIAAEVVEELEARGWPVFYGALGENLTTRGLDIAQVRIGDQVRAGGAILEITAPRGPCGQLDVYGPGIQQELYDKRVKAMDPSSKRWGKSGFYTRVLMPGLVQPDDIIAVVAKLA